MWKALCNPRTAIKLCRCQHVPTESIKFPKNRIHYWRPDHQFKHKVKLQDCEVYNSNVLSTLARSMCTPVGLDDVDSVNDGIEEILDESHEYLNIGFRQIKAFLYENLPDDDELLTKINDCDSEDVLWRTLSDNLEKCSRPQAILFLVKLGHFQKLTYKMTTIDTKDSKNDENLELLLNKIAQHSDDMNVDELAVCFLYATRLSVNMQNDVMATILERILNLIKNGGLHAIPLSALSRFAVAVNLHPQLYTHSISQDILPQILYHLDRVTTSEDLRLLTICLINIHQLVSKDTMELFQKRVSQFVEDGTLKDDSRTTLKILQLLCFPYWSQRHLSLIRTLLFQLGDKVQTLNARELEFAGMVFQVNFEPAAIGETISAYAMELLKKSPTVEVLSSTVLHSTPANRPKLTKLAKELLYFHKNPDFITLKSLFKILRHLKISDPKLCNEYWSKVQRVIMSNPSQQESHILSKYCHRYMHFNNNLNGTYRYIPFEKAVVKLLVGDFEEGISALLPSRFSKAASFILSYGHTPRDKYVFPEFIVSKIETMQEQFTISDCLQLTRGIQIALQMRFKSEINQELAQQIVRLENAFNACTERHLDQPNLSLNDLNSIVRSYTNRKSAMRTSIYRKTIEKYETIPHQPLTSRLIRDITFNLNVAKYHMPNVCNSINEYMVQNHKFVLGDTFHKVLICFYNLNYCPKDENLFKCATETINRDFDTMSGLAVVEACLALAFYKELPTSLIDRVFNISFIQRLEDEIEMCYSKDFYPQRVLNSVMQLNRAVCLDSPECQVPWFQQNYIEAQLTRVPMITNKFHVDVKEVLVNFTRDEKLLKVNHITPYGYRIDFVLYLDEHKKLMIPPSLNDAVLQVNKIAILLLDSDSFCQNDYQNVRGKESLKQRHLEMMGFKVVQINYNQWNSMYMNVPGAKIDYVRDLLSS